MENSSVYIPIEWGLEVGVVACKWVLWQHDRTWVTVSLLLPSSFVRVAQRAPVSKDLDAGSWQKNSARHLSYKTFFTERFIFPSSFAYFPFSSSSKLSGRDPLCDTHERRQMNSILSSPLLQWMGWRFFARTVLKPVGDTVRTANGYRDKCRDNPFADEYSPESLQIRSLCCKVRALSWSNLGFIWRLSKE